MKNKGAFGWKKLLIIGDSYSTYEGHIPDGYPTYYSSQGRPDASVSKMLLTETWWKRLINETKAQVIQNNSWSGSTIGYTGYDNIDCSKSSSFIYRYRQLKEQGFFEKNQIDTVIVFGGTNDSWSGSPLGELQYNGWKEKDLFNVLPAICYFMSTLKNDLPNVRIVFVVNSDIRTEIIDGVKTAGEHFKVEVVELQDIEKDCGHPTVKGMEQICNQICQRMI